MNADKRGWSSGFTIFVIGLLFAALVCVSIGVYYLVGLGFFYFVGSHYSQIESLAWVHLIVMLLAGLGMAVLLLGLYLIIRPCKHQTFDSDDLVENR